MTTEKPLKWNMVEIFSFVFIIGYGISMILSTFMWNGYPNTYTAGNATGVFMMAVISFGVSICSKGVKP